MTMRRERPNRFDRLRRVVALPLSLALALTGLLPASPAAAQERPRTVMEMLFGNSSRQVAPPSRMEERTRPQTRERRGSSRRQSARERRAQGRQQAATRSNRRSSERSNSYAAAPAAAAVEKSEDARTVLVVGDFLATSLAKGLTRSFADDVSVEISDKASGSSGLVRDDHYDWLTELKPLIEAGDPAALVVMVGSNDRQPISLGGQSLALRSDAWTAEYERRVEAVAEIAREAGVPLVWVGMPSFKFDRMSEDMVFLNDLYRQNAANASGEFVDIWDGFVDANGAFSYSGPDVAGQPAQLRNSDGITMTPAGEDKLAFFVRRPLEKVLGQTAVAGASPDAGGEGAMQGPMMPDGLANTPAAPIQLGAPFLDGSDDLLGAPVPSPTRTASAQSPSRTPGDLMVVAGAAASAVEGRADNFDWNDKGDAVTTVISAPPPITAQGSVELGPLRESTGFEPPAPMPSLADAIVEEWSRETEAAQQIEGGMPPAD